MAAGELWQSRFLVPATAVPGFLDALDDAALSVAAFEAPVADGADAERWWVELLHETEPDHDALAARLAPLAERAGLARLDLSIVPVPASDWLARTAEAFPARAIGRFWLHGSHVDDRVPRASIPIQIDAGLAFGSGEHPTTEGCLLALQRLVRRRRPTRVLDLGCGAGILAIAAAKLHRARVIAADIDPIAVDVAGANAVINRVAHRVRAVPSDGYGHPTIRRLAPYDLILANILADPLCGLARGTARHLRPGGFAVLSGLLERQAAVVIAAHRCQRLSLVDAITIGPWTTLVMTRRR